MRIRKISQSAAIHGKIVNSPSDSTTETYSCDYVNEHREEYSTDEVRIGTWIDGKPLYRKTIIGTSYLEGSISYFVDFNIIPDTFVKGYGTLNSSAIGSLQIGDISWDTNRAITYASRIEKSSDNHIKLIWTKNLSIAKYEATIEYTKTTD